MLNHIYSRKGEKGGIEYFWPHEVEDQHDDTGKVIGARLRQAKGDLPAGTSITYEGVGTMSKSKNNGVDPQDLIEKYGADTARLYTMFTAPPEVTLEWNDSAVEGSYRFLRRVWNFAFKNHELLRSATGSDLSLRKAFSNATRALLVFVGLFGLFTVGFGLSTTAWWSIVLLALIGAADMVSVVIRETLLQLWTPDEVRGRVNAVNMVFLGASNELGEFRAGMMAAWIGVVPAVVFGGVGAVGVAVVWALLFPSLRDARYLDGRKE